MTPVYLFPPRTRRPPGLKEHLAGKRHADDEDLQHAVVDWLNSQAAVWYEELAA